MSQPAVSVIIPARDAEPTLQRALNALRAQELGRPFEVIVVDDGSRDRTAEIAAVNAPFVRLIKNARSVGPGAARNRGAEAAQSRVLAFTDADCFPARDWLRHGLEHVVEAELVQGVVLPDPDADRKPFDRTLVVDRYSGFYQTANLFVRREVFDVVGGFRDWALHQSARRQWSVDRRRQRATRTPIGEDTLFAWHARRLGARSAFAANAVVHHEVVRGGIRDEIADRWHWSRDMPGLARLVPELRRHIFFGHWFFHSRTALFDLAVSGLVLALASRRRRWLAAAAPYLRQVASEAVVWGRLGGARYSIGAAAADATTCGGLLLGSIRWRCLVL